MRRKVRNQLDKMINHIHEEQKRLNSDFIEKIKDSQEEKEKEKNNGRVFIYRHGGCFFGHTSKSKGLLKICGNNSSVVETRLLLIKDFQNDGINIVGNINTQGNHATTVYWTEATESFIVDGGFKKWHSDLNYWSIINRNFARWNTALLIFELALGVFGFLLVKENSEIVSGLEDDQVRLQKTISKLEERILRDEPDNAKHEVESQNLEGQRDSLKNVSSD